MKRLAFLPVLLLWNLSLAQAQDPWEAWLWQVAQDTQGIPYRYGGEDPRTGIDCSAFVRWVMGTAGIPLPRTSREQLRATIPVREYRPGYLLSFSESGGKWTTWPSTSAGGTCSTPRASGGGSWWNP
jgi:hypothetical protein